MLSIVRINRWKEGSGISSLDWLPLGSHLSQPLVASMFHIICCVCVSAWAKVVIWPMDQPHKCANVTDGVLNCLNCEFSILLLQWQDPGRDAGIIQYTFHFSSLYIVSDRWCFIHTLCMVLYFWMCCIFTQVFCTVQDAGYIRKKKSCEWMHLLLPVSLTPYPELWHQHH